MTPDLRVLASEWGWMSKSRGHFYFSVMETTYADSWSDMAQPCVGHEVKVTMTYISWSSDFCLISWRLWCMNIILGIMSQYDPTFDLKINVGHCDLYFMVQWLCLILKTIWCTNIIIGIMHQLPHQMYVGQWAIFPSPAIMLIIS